MFLCYLVVILYFFLLLLHDSTSWHVYLKAHTFCFWVKRWSLSYSVTISIYWCWQSSSKNRKLIKAFMKALPSISILIASAAVVELTIWVVSMPTWFYPYRNLHRKVHSVPVVPVSWASLFRVRTLFMALNYNPMLCIDFTSRTWLYSLHNKCLEVMLPFN